MILGIGWGVIVRAGRTGEIVAVVSSGAFYLAKLVLGTNKYLAQAKLVKFVFIV